MYAQAGLQMGFQVSMVHAVLQEQFVSKESIITIKCLF